MEELAEAFPLVGSNYTYLYADVFLQSQHWMTFISLNASSKSIALAGAAITLLDSAMTVVVSSATASSYLSSEVHPPFPTFVITVLLLLGFATLCLSGTRDSARMASGILGFHVCRYLSPFGLKLTVDQILTMIVLMVTAAVAWARQGNKQIANNWHSGDQASAGAILYQIFKGVCIGFLGLSGFECVNFPFCAFSSSHITQALLPTYLQ